MTQKKKLQVFVSSTYQDLRAERQAAVEAILTAGHIPAGMELFSAGDESQMEVIKRWIDESDVFLLVLGGRYGSVEPTSGKSYIHLEYEYAVSRAKPLFAVVIDEQHREDRVKSHGIHVVETENAPKLREFREQILTRLVKFWSDPRDIKLAVYETMSDFSRRADLMGWIPGSQAIDAGSLAGELARLAKENSELRRQLAESGISGQTYSGLRFDELFGLLSRETFDPVESNSEEDTRFVDTLNRIAEREGDPNPKLLHALLMMQKQLIPAFETEWENRNIRNVMRRFEYYGLTRWAGDNHDEFYPGERFEITQDGQKFILRLIVERRAQKVSDNPASEALG
ncbi:MAG TPA: DUF4062 domain-containing protein [Longimicrobium sp.]|nr:DUF4062 domain-containing protein [Longimicrobium sp.]